MKIKEILTKRMLDIGIINDDVSTNEQYLKLEKALILSVSIERLSTADELARPSLEYIKLIKELRVILKELDINY